MAEKQLINRPVIRRVEAVDLFKFFILFFMIQGHLFRAYLMEPIRQAGWFAIHEILHGMVAPAFLFSAGFAAFLSYYNKKEQYVRPGRSFFTRLRRILFVIWCGYWIHLPFFSLRKTFRQISQGEVVEFLKVDILQCIGAGLLLFVLVAVLLKKEKVIAVVSAVFSLLFFLLPPLASKLQAWYIIDPYFSYKISMFPLFPWAGFLFLGVICAYFYSLLDKNLFFKLVLVTGIVFVPWYFFYKSPVFARAELTLTGSLTKIGGVLLLLWVSNWLAAKFRGGWLEVLKKAGKEPLFVYVLHLFIIFGSVFGPGLQRIFKNALNVPEALGLFLAVQSIVFALALGYNFLKEKHRRVWRFSFYIFWAVFLLVFILRPY